ILDDSTLLDRAPRPRPGDLLLSAEPLLTGDRPTGDRPIGDRPPPVGWESEPPVPDPAAASDLLSSVSPPLTPARTASGSGNGKLLPTRIGPYEVEGELGRGAMGVVLKARDPRLDRHVAIKLLLHEGGEALDTWRRRLQRFELEARATARLRHPNVVPILEVGRHAEQPYL
ncbi:MAG: hypothetical protein KC457_37565, partial [Myxococcales bacterium]|nr:hypothetical protein [Myxococcales bacterium]